MNSHLVIEVEDSGVGITPEDQQRIFEPFVQLGEHAGGKGTGLGLAITRQLVQVMGGSIRLESAPGKGSIFRVELPLTDAVESDIAKPRQVEDGEVVGLIPGQPEYRVLIVEDQRDNQVLMAQLLESVGFKIKIAENGAEGVQIFSSCYPHFIWMDRRMPVMDGMEATRRIRELPDGKEVKIVAVTASVFADQRDEILDVGMDDFVRKPFRAAEIYACMSKHLGVKFLYQGARAAQRQEVKLTSGMLDALPEGLRSELEESLVSLDAERIQASIERLAEHDEALKKALEELAGNFDYPAILRALGRTDKT
jgi:CheY-like chemotaxis protein